MLILHIRTVAFIASLSTAIQSIIWFIGYILYILAYSCSYKSSYFSNQSNENLPLNLPPYFIWYLQGSNCTTSSDWITHTRGKSTELVMVLFSIGLFLNCALLGLSISLLVGLYTNLRLYYTILAYSIGAYLISFWDIILVAYIGLDFAPLLNSKNYIVGKPASIIGALSSQPGDMVMSFFISVFTIIILLLSRFVFIWIFNILSVTFLLFKNKSVKSEAQGSGKSTNQNSNARPTSLTNETPEKPWPPVEQDNKFWGSPATKDSALSKWHIPAPQQESPPDEVQQRWKIHRESSQPFSRNASIVDNNNLPQIARTNTHLSSCSEDRWKDVENHIRGSDDKWRRNDSPAVTNVRNVESFNRSPTSPKRPSFLRSIRESFRKTPLEINQPQMLTEEPSSKPKSIDGFSHFAYPENTTGVDVKEMLGVRLRHVQRPSISNDQSEPENENSGENQATPYAISPIVDIDDDRFKSPFFLEKLRHVPGNPNSGSGAGKRLILNTPPVPPPEQPPPDSPPPDAPPLKHSGDHVGFKAQMSLEEAIRTRRPLRPVNRPAIDTNC